MKKDAQTFPKVTTDDIRAIPISDNPTPFFASSGKELNSIKSRVYQLNSSEPELGKKFSCKVLYDRNMILIKALPL